MTELRGTAPDAELSNLEEAIVESLQGAERVRQIIRRAADSPQSAGGHS